MRLALSSLLRDFRSRVIHVARCWDEFWFKPAEPINLGVLRILSGLMLLYTHFVWGLRLEEFFGPEGWQDPLLIQVQQQESTAWSFWNYVPVDWMRAAHWSAMAVLLLYTLGLWTRCMSVLAFLVVISYATRAMNANFGLDQINTLLTFYLMLGPAGATLSLDRWLRKRRDPDGGVTPRISARVALRLIQLHMCVIYAFAALSKLKGEAWWDGNAFWMSVANTEYRTLDLTWLAWHPWLGELITHVSLAWELTFCVLIWNRHWRPLVLLMGMLVHVGIGAFLGMWTFGLVMMFTYIAFLDPATLHGILQPLVGRRRTVMAEQSVDDTQAMPSEERAIRNGTSQVVKVMGLFVSGMWMFAGCGGGGGEREVLLEQGRLYVAREDFPKAIQALSRGLEALPDDRDLLYERARAYELSNQLDAALTDYTRATDVDPRFAAAHNNRGTVLARLNRFEEAVASFSKAIEVDPGDALAIRNRGLAHHDLGRTEEGLADFDRAIALDPGSAEPWFMKGNLCVDAKRFDDAVHCYGEAVRLNPQHARAWFNRSEAYAALGHADLAQQDRERALTIDPALGAGNESEAAPPAPAPLPIAAPAPAPAPADASPAP